MEEETLLASADDKDPVATVSAGDRLWYYLENILAASPGAKFNLLVLVTFVFWVVYTILWGVAGGTPLLRRLKALHPAHGEDNAVVEEEPALDWPNTAYHVFQILAAGGVDDTFDIVQAPWSALVFMLTLMTGLMVFAVLVGFVNETVTALIDSINQGDSKVCVKDHTLTLGWNESTVRAVCQIGFLRRAYMDENAGLMKKVFFWKRTKASTPVAIAPVVVLCNKLSKAEMEGHIVNGLQERGISMRYMKAGWDVVCRIGDPTVSS